VFSDVDGEGDRVRFIVGEGKGDGCAEGEKDGKEGSTSIHLPHSMQA